ncbi:alpha-L-fucosidase [Lentzea tibetensis]|uniref:alpha-L-fucosidase n=1 Tax=Lentzea tibetensis TaxID=2591470 RepID=A0A563EE94_9PSEU|nr:alpha-L-fucosidase [Lentzea tibetensis]TWP43238.1 alpha-L-fucosidase [Lentzea tibetensis]
MLGALLTALLMVLPLAGPGTNHAVDDPFTSERTSWYRDARFGMFIHFGAYSHLEGEYKRSDGSTCQDAEWIFNKCKIPVGEYEKLVKNFNPAQFDPKAIVGTAKAAGQKYIVITSKHHDGYAMWPTKVNKWSLRDHSSFDKSRDVLKELKAEADRQGIKFGLYYSTWDWHDPDARSTANFSRYKARMRAQLVELMDNYDPALLWFDGDWDTNNPANPWTKQDGAELESFLRSASPDMLINNRISKRAPGVKERRVVDGDFGTPEQTFPSAPIEGQLWESCMTIPTKWGYAKWDTKLKDSKTLTRNLIDISSRSGNYLLNVGPDKLGRIPAGEADRLRAMGSWLGSHGSAVYGAGASGWVADPAWGAVSQKGDKVYLSVYDWANSLHLKVLENFDVLSARVLGSPQTVSVTKAGDGFDVKPSGAKTNDVASVIELTVRGEQAAPVGTGTGLAAEYFPTANWTGTPVRRVEPSINFAWRFDGSPATTIGPDNFSARWSGFVQPRFSDTYTFTTVSDDLAKVWVDGKLVVDASAPHQVRLDKGTIALQAGRKYAIKVEFAETKGEAFMKLNWSSPNLSQQVVPSEQLYTN